MGVRSQRRLRFEEHALRSSGPWNASTAFAVGLFSTESAEQLQYWRSTRASKRGRELVGRSQSPITPLFPMTYENIAAPLVAAPLVVALPGRE
jgi:hypothetical protein